MRFERLVIDGGDAGTFALDFHPRLTVIAGVGRAEREGLMAELVGTLGASRTGGHLEWADDQGRHLAVFRPHGARHRVVDVDAGIDVSDAYRAPTGEIDLLAHEGFDQLTAKRRLRLSGADLAQTSQSSATIRRLAGVDPTELWRAADAVRASEADLQRLAEEVGSAPEDLALVERIEHRHTEFEAAQEHHERLRRLSFRFAFAVIVAAVPAAWLAGLAPALGLITLAVAATAGSLIVWMRMRQAQAAEREALEEAGADSYLGFHLQRVNSLLASDQSRKRLTVAADNHRAATNAWRALAGDVDVDWALEHRDEVVAAARLRAETKLAEAGGDDLVTALAQELVVRLGEARRIARSGECLPIVFDEPFGGFDSSVTSALLELISQASDRQQIVLLTDDPDVVSWARLESITGNLAVVEPSGRAEERTRTRSRIVL